jgi:hypothetical protein
MKYRITKMDGRYTRYGYKYLIEFSKMHSAGTGVLDFDRCRRWFNEQFGWSQDVETRQKMKENKNFHSDAYEENDINPVWAYCVKYGDYRIYIDDDKTLSWFVLTHPATP